MDNESLLAIQRKHNWYLPWSLLLYHDIDIWGAPSFWCSRQGFHIDELATLIASVNTTPLAAPFSAFTPTCTLHSFRLTGLSSVECPFSSFASSLALDSFDAPLAEDRRLCQLNATTLDALLAGLAPCAQLEYLGIRGERRRAR